MNLRLLLTIQTAALVLFVPTSEAVTRPITVQQAAVAQAGITGAGTVDPARQRALTRSSAWQQFRSLHGDWHVQWNERTGTPHRAFGDGIALSGFSADPSAVDRAVRGFVGGHPELFGAGRRLETVRVEEAAGLWYARYRQTVNGVPVLFEDWEFRVGRDGRLTMFGADAHGVPSDVRTRPTIVAAAAREAAKQGLAFDPATDRVEGGAVLGLLPLATESGTEYRLVYDVRVSTANPPGRWITLVDAADGAVLWRHDRVRYAITGGVTGQVHADLPTGTLVSLPFRNQIVKTTTDSSYSDAAGNYSVTGPAATTLSAALRGRFCDVGRADGGAEAIFSTPANDPSTVPVDWTTANATDAERDSYYHTTFVHDHVKALDPTFTGNDYRMPCTVNINSTCNAFWDGTGINFYVAGGGCPNTATMPDVVYHEYGHSINDNVYLQHGAPFGMTNGALHEGMSDVNAAFIQDSPDVGKGFFGPGTVLRSIDNTNRWPDDQSGDPHITGLIIGGAFWDLRQSVGLALAESLSYFAKYGIPDDPDDGQAMSEYFVEVLNRDNANGGLHTSAIVAAFNAHGIGTAFFIDIAHTPLADQPGSSPYPVTATITSTRPAVTTIDASSPTVFYSINGAPFTSTPMTPAGPPDQYTGSIPGQTRAIVRYYIRAGDTNGGTATDPPGAVLGTSHLFLAGPASTVFLQDHESDAGWTVGAPGDNATTGIWLWANPVGTDVNLVPVQPEDDHTSAPGVLCFVTGNANPGAGAGTNDVDGGHTTLTTAAFNALAPNTSDPAIEYYRWYSNNAGAAPSSDVWRTQISNDDGTTWVEVENTSVTDNSWKRVVFFISDYVTPTDNMRMRFVAADEGAGSLVEAAVDDFRLLAFPSTVGVEIGGGSRSIAFAPAAPNPFVAATRIRFTLSEPGAVALRVYDVGGRQVRRLAEGGFEPGTHDVEWDGRDDAGRPVASGTYFARLRLGDRELARRIVKAR